MFVRIMGVAAIALACSAGLSQADEKVRVGTPEATGFSFSVPDVGNAVGIFKKYGLEVERIDFAGGAKMHQAMDAGALDVDQRHRLGHPVPDQGRARERRRRLCQRSRRRCRW